MSSPKPVTLISSNNFIVSVFELEKRDYVFYDIRDYSLLVGVELDKGPSFSFHEAHHTQTV